MRVHLSTQGLLFSFAEDLMAGVYGYERIFAGVPIVYLRDSKLKGKKKTTFFAMSAFD